MKNTEKFENVAGPGNKEINYYFSTLNFCSIRVTL